MDRPVISVLDEVAVERWNQDQKWGANRTLPHWKWCLILGEEVGEVNTAVLERDPSNYREELIQVAAVAIAAVEGYDRDKGEDENAQMAP